MGINTSCFCVSSSFFFSFALSSSTETCLDRRCLLSAKAEYFQESESSKFEIEGLGSSPPRCTSKCGKCIPCKAVHVAVPPRTPLTTDYYPEAWRCKCCNKFYIPSYDLP